MKTTKMVKEVLSPAFGRSNVSVKSGRGTARGWVCASITVLKSKLCVCKENELYCGYCRQSIQETEARAENLVYSHQPKIEFNNFYSDNYPEPRKLNCFLLTVNIAR